VTLLVRQFNTGHYNQLSPAPSPRCWFPGSSEKSKTQNLPHKQGLGASSALRQAAQIRISPNLTVLPKMLPFRV
jgi:hypothetical protein